METDPTGKKAHDPGSKLDAGKVRAGLVISGFSRALKEVAAVGTFGANKYTPNGWKKVPDGIERYTDALYRHLLTEGTGEALDPDSNLLHAAHAAWNALARLELMLADKEETIFFNNFIDSWGTQYFQAESSSNAKSSS